MQTLLSKEAEDIRRMFIYTFIDTVSDYYLSQIKAKVQCSDGICYTGYLWDCLKNRNRVSLHYILKELNNKPSPFYALWDIHSREQILIPDYWKYPKEAVLIVNSSELGTLIDTLPEDCYFFDQSLMWAFALTHEELKLGRRLCYETKCI